MPHSADVPLRCIPRTTTPRLRSECPKVDQYLADSAPTRQEQIFLPLRLNRSRITEAIENAGPKPGMHQRSLWKRYPARRLLPSGTKNRDTPAYGSKRWANFFFCKPDRLTNRQVSRSPYR